MVHGHGIVLGILSIIVGFYMLLIPEMFRPNKRIKETFQHDYAKCNGLVLTIIGAMCFLMAFKKIEIALCNLIGEFWYFIVCCVLLACPVCWLGIRFNKYKK